MRSDDKIREGRLVLILNDDNIHATRAVPKPSCSTRAGISTTAACRTTPACSPTAKGRELMTVGLLRHANEPVLLNRMDR